MHRLIAALRHGADAVAAGMLAAIFVIFIVQIVARYILNLPLGWTVEVCLTLWLWLVLWGSAFCLRDSDHVKFDLMYHMVRPRTQRIFAAISALAVVVALVVALPDSWSYVDFYKIKKSATLRIPLNYIFVIYIFFSVALIARYAWGLIRILRNRTSSEWE